MHRLCAHPQLAAAYQKVILVDPLQYGAQKISPTILADPRVQFVDGSIYDPSVADAIVGAGDLVIHLAAQVNSFTAPQTTSDDDPAGYLRRMAEAKVGRLLFLSTADVYGVNESSDLQETDEIRPTTVYAAAKAAFEAYLHAFHATHALPFIAFRPVTIFGPQQYPGWLIPRVITQAIRNQPITLTGDGSVRRDWIYVSDVCDLLVKAALHPDENIHGQVFNVGTGQECSVLSLTRHILGATGTDESLVTFVPDRPGDLPRQITSASRARQTFGWQPSTPLQEALNKTIAWYQDQISQTPQAR